MSNDTSFETSNEIMIVDDNQENLDVLADLLLFANYQVRPLISPDLAIKSAIANPPDLILLDVLMPDINGFEVCRRLKKEPRTKDIPVLFISALTDMDEQLKGFKEGGLDFITKPLQCDAVLARVSTHLKLYNTQRQLSQLIVYRTEELKKSEDKYSHLVKALQNDCFFYSLNIEGEFNYLSSAVENILGYNPEEFIACYSKYISKDLLKQIVDSVKISVNEEDAERELFQASITGKYGNKYCLEFQSFPVFNEKNKLIHIDGIAHDITERKKAEVEFKNSQIVIAKADKLSAVGRLSGGIAHYLNNMLAVISGFTDLLQSKNDFDDESNRYFKRITNAVDNSVDIIQQLMAFSQTLPISLEVSNINNVISKNHQMLQLLLGDDIAFKFKPELDLWDVKIDLQHLNQILVNICLNAKDAIKDKGEIIIETQNTIVGKDQPIIDENFIPGKYIVISISDNGCGINPNDIGDIFEPFYTTKSIHENNGLGLAATYGIIKQNKGFININSENKGGTKFDVYIPRYEALD